jgi:ApaG protein
MKRAIHVEARSTYLESESDPAASQYVFAYTITIRNDSSDVVQLLARHWIITDALNSVHEVRGDGVVGEQPVLHPGESFEYTSGSQLPTEIGTMHGSYRFRGPLADDVFDVEIPLFVLSLPRVLH